MQRGRAWTRAAAGELGGGRGVRWKGRLGGREGGREWGGRQGWSV